MLDIYKGKIEYETNCTAITQTKWDKLMKGNKKANGSLIRKMIKEQLPELYHELALNFYNPYEAHCRRTKTHLIYVHSNIEYFLKVTY